MDVKSPEILGVLREVLKDISGVSLRETKPTVCDFLLQLAGFIGEYGGANKNNQNLGRS